MQAKCEEWAAHAFAPRSVDADAQSMLGLFLSSDAASQDGFCFFRDLVVGALCSITSDFHSGEPDFK